MRSSRRWCSICEMPIPEEGSGIHVCPKPDAVNHPKHYNQGKIEVIEYIEDKQLDFHLGNAVKYICRAGKKDTTKYVEDLEKAIWYIRRRIAIHAGEPPRPNEMPQTRVPDQQWPRTEEKT